LRKYLISKLYKKWSYLNKNTFKEYLLNYEKYILSEVDNYKYKINYHIKKIKHIKKLEKDYTKLSDEINSRKIKFDELFNEINKLKYEIGYPDIY
jgi:predicted  nucleic acid-binding Zn-ribbon protein